MANVKQIGIISKRQTEKALSMLSPMTFVTMKKYNM